MPATKVQCDCGAATEGRWKDIHSKGCAVFIAWEERDHALRQSEYRALDNGFHTLNLYRINRFLQREMAKNGGALPDYLIPMDLTALHNLAEASERQRDHDWDQAQYREECELGGRAMSNDREQYSESFLTSIV